MLMLLKLYILYAFILFMRDSFKGRKSAVESDKRYH